MVILLLIFGSYIDLIFTTNTINTLKLPFIYCDNIRALLKNGHLQPAYIPMQKEALLSSVVRGQSGWRLVGEWKKETVTQETTGYNQGGSAAQQVQP